MNMRASPLPLPKEAALAADEPAPLRILITRRTDRETIADVQAMLSDLGFDAGNPDGVLGSTTRGAIDAYKRWKGFATKGPVLTAEVISALYASAGRAEPPNGQVMIRQGFQEVLSEPIGIGEPGVALGTHFLTVTALNRDKGTAEWQGLSLDNHLSDATRKRLGITTDAVSGPMALKAVLDRIHVPDDLRQRIGAMISTGTSLTISDTGVGPETTKGTDFITVTHRPPRG